MLRQPERLATLSTDQAVQNGLEHVRRIAFRHNAIKSGG
jgi:hypothetical protein